MRSTPATGDVSVPVPVRGGAVAVAFGEGVFVVATVAEEVERRSRGMGQGIFFTVHTDPAASAGGGE